MRGVDPSARTRKSRCPLQQPVHLPTSQSHALNITDKILNRQSASRYWLRVAEGCDVRAEIGVVEFDGQNIWHYAENEIHSATSTHSSATN